MKLAPSLSWEALNQETSSLTLTLRLFEFKTERLSFAVSVSSMFIFDYHLLRGFPLNSHRLYTAEYTLHCVGLYLHFSPLYCNSQPMKLDTESGHIIIHSLGLPPSWQRQLCRVYTMHPKEMQMKISTKFRQLLFKDSNWKGCLQNYIFSRWLLQWESTHLHLIHELPSKFYPSCR